MSVVKSNKKMRLQIICNKINRQLKFLALRDERRRNMPMAANDNLCPHDHGAPAAGDAERSFVSLTFAAQFAIWAVRA